MKLIRSSLTLTVPDHKRRLVLRFYHLEFRQAACANTRSLAASRTLRCWALFNHHTYDPFPSPSCHCIVKPLVFVGTALHRQCSWVTSDDASPYLPFSSSFYRILHLPQRCLVAKAASLTTTKRLELHADRWDYGGSPYSGQSRKLYHQEHGTPRG